MGDIRLSVGQVNITDHLLIIFREVQNPNAIVRQLDEYPVPASFNIFESGFNNVVHYIDFRNSVDGVSLGTLLSTFVYDVKEQRLIGERRYYIVDGGGANDPVSGDMFITDPYLDGKNIYGVFKENFRFLVPEMEWEHVDDTVTLLVGGEFQPAEVIMVEISYQQDTPGGGGAAFPADIVDVPNDMTITASEYNMMLEANGSNTILTITMPDFITIPDLTKFQFNTDKGAQRYLAIVLPGGAYCQVGNKQRTTIYMGKGEQLSVIKKGNYLRIINWTGDHMRVGRKEKADGTAPLNSIPELGGWLLKTDYPRIFNWYVNELPPGELGTGTQDVNPDADNRTKWIIGSTKFWVPDTGGYFDRAIDPDGNIDDVRLAGSNQADAVGPAQVRTVSFTGVSIGKNSVSANPGFLATLGDGGVVASDSASGTNNNSRRTDTWSVISPAGQTRPRNVATNVYRII